MENKIVKKLWGYEIHRYFRDLPPLDLTYDDELKINDWEVYLKVTVDLGKKTATYQLISVKGKKKYPATEDDFYGVCDLLNIDYPKLEPDGLGMQSIIIKDLKLWNN